MTIHVIINSVGTSICRERQVTYINMHDCDEKQVQHSLYPNNTGMLHEIL